MGQKIKLDNEEYDVDDLSDQARVTVELLQFTTSRSHELNNMKALLTRAQKSYLDSLKKEIVSNKGGFEIDIDY